MYFQMLRIRKVQLKIESHYLENEMKTPVHLYIGQEAIATGVSFHLKKDDYINSNHRSHGHYLAKGGNLKALIAELYCKETGCSKGRGGSMHLIDTSVGHLGSSSIVGGGIPIATGMALAIKMKKSPRVSVAYFSDGAVDEGILYESINFAVLKKVPVIFIFENNQYSVCSHVSTRRVGESVFHQMPPEHLFTKKIDGNNVIEVAETAEKAITAARSGSGPAFIECVSYRIRGHAGCESQDFKGYRSVEEINQWKAKCPLVHHKEVLQAKGLISDADIATMEKAIDAEIQEAFEFARSSPLPSGKDVEKLLYCEEPHALV